MFKSPKMQRFIASSVTALLAANAIVLVTGILSGDAAKPAAPQTVTYIQNPDGTQTLVDPTTPEGWEAIREANERGEQVVTSAAEDAPAEVQAQQESTTTLPTTPTSVTVPEVVNTVVSTVNSVVDDVEDTINGTVDDVEQIIEDTTGEDVDVPDVTVPDVTVPNVTVPNVTTPTTSAPVTTPAVTVPPALPSGGTTVVPPVEVTVPGL